MKKRIRIKFVPLAVVVLCVMYAVYAVTDAKSDTVAHVGNVIVSTLGVAVSILMYIRYGCE